MPKKIDTVSELIAALAKFPADMPVRIAIPSGREGEYVSIDDVSKNHLKNQNTDGDPSEYWNNQSGLPKDERLQPDDSHYKHKGKLVLLS